MSKSYINVPMTEEEAQRFRDQDAKWNGPKLMVLCAVTLGAALLLLWALAWEKIGPNAH